MNVAFGIVGMTQVAAWPEKCPDCGHDKFLEISAGWNAKNDNEKELDDLKVTRANKFISEFPDNKYSSQFEPRKFTKGQLEVLEIAKKKNVRLEERDALILARQKKRQERLREKELLYFKRKYDAEARIEEKKEKQRVYIREVYELKKGRTLEQVGQILGVTGERVRQILNRGVSLGLGSYEKSQRKKLPRVNVICPCGKTFSRYERQSNKKHCGRDCKKKYPIWKHGIPTRLYWREQRKLQWKNDPEYRAHHTALVKKRYLQVRCTDRHKELQKKYSKDYFDRINSDPAKLEAWKKKYLEYQREKFRLLKLDPVKYKEFRRKMTERGKRYRQRIYSDPIRSKEWRQKVREKSRLYHERLRNNPERWKKYKLQQKEYYQIKKKRNENKET